MAVNGTSFTIAGIAPAEFFGVKPGSSPDVFVPLSQYVRLLPEYSGAAAEPGGQAPQPLTPDARVWWLVVVGRLLPAEAESGGARAQAELAVLFNQSIVNIGAAGKAQANPKTPVLEILPASQGLDGLRRRFSRPLFVLMAMGGVVLLMACANAAGLLLAPAAARQREIGVRLSLGARRSRLIRQLLTESTMLAVMGGAAGVLLARWASSVLVAWLSSGRDPLVLALHLDARILAFTVAVSVLTGVLFGLAPAWHATRVDLGPALKQGGGSPGDEQVCIGQDPGGRTGCPMPAPAGERGAVPAHAGESGSDGHRVPARPASSILRAAGLERLPGRAAGELLRGTSAAYSIHRSEEH